MTIFDVDPNVVRPGWTPLIITIVLAAAVALLARSMRKQFRKINVPYADEVRPQPRTTGSAPVDLRRPPPAPNGPSAPAGPDPR